MNLDNYYKKYGHDPTKYVSIGSADFDVHMSMTRIASRIDRDERFNEQCKKWCEGKLWRATEE